MTFAVNSSAISPAFQGTLDQIAGLPELPFGLSFELMESVLFDRLDDGSAWVLEQLTDQSLTAWQIIVRAGGAGWFPPTNSTLWRRVDRSIQRLRKAGKIKRTKEGWVLR